MSGDRLVVETTGGWGGGEGGDSSGRSKKAITYCFVVAVIPLTYDVMRRIHSQHLGLSIVSCPARAVRVRLVITGSFSPSHLPFISSRCSKQ